MRAARGELRIRPMERPVHDPEGAGPHVEPRTVQLSFLGSDLPLLNRDSS